MGNALSKPDDFDHHNHLTDSWFINSSDTQIPSVVAKILGLGKNFGTPFPLSEIPMKHLIADFESNIHKIQENDRTAARLKFVICVKSFSNQKQTSLNSFKKRVIKNSKCTKTFLKNNPHILITNADKGNTTVAMDKNKYIQEATLMLSDKKLTNPYKKTPQTQFTIKLTTSWNFGKRRIT